MTIRGSHLFASALAAVLLVAGCAAPAAPPAPTSAPTAAAKPAAAPAAASPAPAPATSPAPAASPALAASPAASPVASPAVAASPSPAAGAYRPTPLSPPQTVRIGMLAAMANAPLYIADDKGYFKDEGLEVDMTTLQAGTQLLPALASEKLDAGVSSPGAALFNAIGRDIPMRIVADMGRYSPGHGFGAFVVRKDLADQIRDVKDLKGRHIAVTGKGVATYMTTLRWLEQNGMSESDVSLEFLGFPDMLTAMASKQIDVAQQTEPFVAQGTAQGVSVRWKGDDELFPNQQQSVLMFPPKFIQERRDVAQRVLIAYERGLRDYMAATGPAKTNQAEINQILAKHLNIGDPSIFTQTVPIGFDPNGFVNVADLKDQQDWYAEQGLVQTPVNVDSVVDTSFIEGAIAKLGRAS